MLTGDCAGPQAPASISFAFRFNAVDRRNMHCSPEALMGGMAAIPLLCQKPAFGLGCLSSLDGTLGDELAWESSLDTATACCRTKLLCSSCIFATGMLPLGTGGSSKSAFGSSLWLNLPTVLLTAKHQAHDRFCLLRASHRRTQSVLR